VESYVPELSSTVGDALLEPHRSYLAAIAPSLDSGHIKAMAHITGGGITDNLPRVLPQGVAAVIDRTSWEVPAIFAWLAENGRIADAEMFRTFNMGIGLIIVTARDRADALIRELAAPGSLGARVVGELVPGHAPEVRYV